MNWSARVAAALLLSVSAAQAQVHGVAVQVSNGKRIPTVEQLRRVLNPGDYVRDVLGWHKVDKKCNLRGNPSAQIVIPAPMAALYANVQEAGGKNFVTLAFNNKFCGQGVNGGGETFPNTPLLISEFAAYAAAVVRQVPALGGVSIWNELNGTWDGGYTSQSQKLSNYCRLANAAIAEVRKIDPKLPIAIGASVSWDIGTWFIDMFDTYGCVGRSDPSIWLDVHPYLAGKIVKSERKADWVLWNDEVGRIRAAGIANPLVSTEWGAKPAYTWLIANPSGNYMKQFRNKVTNQNGPWAAAMWYQMLYDKSTPNAGIFDSTGTTFMPLGFQYVNEFKH